MQASVASPPSAGALAADLAAVYRAAFGRASAGFVAVVEELDLSVTQIKLLHVLDAEEPTLGRLADAVGLSLAATSRAVDGLEARGLVARREDRDDRRQRRIRATPPGREGVRRLDEARLHGLERYLGALTPLERQALAAGLAPLLGDEPVPDPRPQEVSS